MQIIANFSQMLVSVNTRNIGRLMKIKSEHNMNVSEDYPFPTLSPISNIQSYTIKCQKYCLSAPTKNEIQICISVQ